MEPKVLHELNSNTKIVSIREMNKDLKSLVYSFYEIYETHMMKQIISV